MWGMLQLARRAKLAINDFQSITRRTYRSSSILLIFEIFALQRFFGLLILVAAIRAPRRFS
jgi:hypothetical protein